MSEFDKVTHIRDRKSGKIISTNPYRVYVTRNGTDAIRIFERDGVKYYENGEPVEQTVQLSEPTLDAVVDKIATAPDVSKVTAKIASQKAS